MDPRTLSLPSQSVTPKRDKAPRHKPGERFLLGPIPWDWLCAASKAAGRGSGFQVAVALWHLSGLNHKAKTVKLSGSMLREMGIKRHAAYRALETLEAACLVRVERHDGLSPTVTLLGIRHAGGNGCTP